MVERHAPKLLLLGVMTLVAFGCVRLGYDEPPPREPRPDQGPAIVDSSIPDAVAPADGAASDLAHSPDAAPLADHGTPDALQADAGTPDAPVPDAPAPDVGQPDSGTVPGIWVSLSKGTFTMGYPPDEACAGTSLDMRKQVTLTHDFEILATEVMQASFLEVMGYNPSHFSATGAGVDCGPTCPVETVTWSGAAAYCNALSLRRGLATCYACTGSGADVACQEAAAYDAHAIYTCPGYRLPTSAEWEYAYRAGSTTAFYSGDITAGKCTSCTAPDKSAADIGWYCANSGDLMHPAQQRQPNAWGLYDMAGNVWELCHDWYASSGGGLPVSDPLNSTTGSQRVVRGGSYISLSSSLRAAMETSRAPAVRSRHYGFRWVRTTSF